MKKIISSLFLTAFCSASALAQQTIVTGTVLDSLSRQGEPSAVIQFFKVSEPDKPIAFTTTDADGRFAQPLTGKGGYRLLFSGVGRRAVTRDFELDGSGHTLDLGVILIQDDVRTLDAGSVTAQRPLVKMEVDRMTYDVAHDVDSRTSTVLDMLRKVPMVSVDGQDNITVKALEDMLPEGRFMRVHRSYIVALDRIDSVSAGGDISIGGVFIHVSDSYRSTFDAWLDSHSLIFIDR